MIQEQVILLLLDLAKGTQIRNYYNFYKSTLGWSKEELAVYRTKKLKKLVNHAYQNVPYYKSKFDDIGFTPDDIQRVDDIQKLPILERTDIQNNTDQLKSKNYKNKVFAGSSSGTTGIPIKYYQDIDSYSAGLAAIYLLRSMSGWRVGMRGIHIWGNIASVEKWKRIPSRLKRILLNQKYISSILLNDVNIVPEVIRTIQKFKPVFLDGYTNAIYEIAIFLKNHHLSIPSIKYIFTTAENLEPHQKKLIEEYLAPVQDDYGFSEINSIASMLIKSDKYVIFEPHVIVECFQSDDKKMKDVIVTDLDNYYMPFIRYRVGDLIDDVYTTDKNEPTKYSYFKNIYGRSSDVIILENGEKIYPVNIFGGTLYRKFTNITQHKVCWNGKKLKFIFSSNGDLNKNELRRLIQASLKEYRIDFHIEYTDRILPSKNGKYTYFEIEK